MTEARNPAAPGSRWQEAKIAKIERRTPRVTSFFFTLATPLAFRAGQHVDVRLTAPDGYSAQRSYSIASGPEETTALELAIEKLDRGEVSPFFHEVAQVGDDIELRGPIGGHFVWGKEDGGPILLVGAGSGVAPLMSMIRHRAASGANTPMLLVLSARTWEDVIFRDELLALHDRKDGFQLALTLTRETPQRAGDYGRRIDAPMFAEVLQRLPQPLKRSYICGSNAFVSVASDALIAAGTEAGAIRTERYGV
ncbi:MAG TPA: ferredoxin reductase [Xanthobacteraceae bacterium]|nr:ferredoxin reductase [Xanthobacteraceae bacterium]